MKNLFITKESIIQNSCKTYQQIINAFVMNKLFFNIYINKIPFLFPQKISQKVIV